MPPVIGALIVGGLSAAGVTGVAGASLAATTVFGVSLANVVGSVVVIGASVGIAYALRPKPPKPEDGAQTKRLSISSRLGGYGRTRLFGTYVLYEASADGKSVDVLALLSGKISNFKQFYLHEDPITLVGNIVQSGTDGRYSDSSVQLLTRQGLAAETAYAEAIAAVPEVWTSAHKGNGVASMEIVAKSVGADKFQKIYPHGPPEGSAVADLYAVWDFRDPAQSASDPNTWVAYPAWSAATTYAAGARVLYQGVVYISAAAGNINFVPDTRPDKWANVWQNPVLQIVDYLTHTDHGMGLDRARLITPALAGLIEAANDCDFQVARKGGLTEPRYRSSGTYTFDTAPEGVLGEILAACDGWMAENGDGSLSLRVGVYRAPTVRIDYKHILGFGVRYGVADEDDINVLPISISHPGFLYKATPCEPWRDEAAIALAGRERSRNLDLQWVQSFSQSRRLAKKAAIRAQTKMRGSVVTDLYGLAALGERYVTLNYPFISGLAEAVVEIQGAKIDLENGRVTLEWLFYDPALDTWDPATEEGTAPVVPPDAAPQFVPTPQNPAVDLATAVLSFDELDRTDYTYAVQSRKWDASIGAYTGWGLTLYPTATTFGGRTSIALSPVPVAGQEYQVAVRSGRTIGEFSTTAVAGVDPAALALKARMTVPPTWPRLEQINNLIMALKSAGVWAKLDGLYILAAHDEQAARLNWIADRFNLTLGGVGPLFTTDRGYAGFTSTAYLDSGFMPTTASPKVMLQDSAHLGVYVRDNSGVNTGHDAGAAAGTSHIDIMARVVANTINAAVNGSADVTGPAATDSRGHTLVVRDSATVIKFYKNGASVGSVAQTSTGLVGRTILFGAKNLTTPTAAGRALGAGHFGALITAAEATPVYNAIQAYMVAVGASV